MRFIVTDEQIQNCIAAGIEVEIYIHSELEFTGGIIGYSDDSIHTDQGKYLRENCEIKTMQNYLKLV
ncbi:hypothetical protein [Paenibacillus kandeliae]|uniref:hypothetical protein n=1 Tax=Paenibacillus kandeliae TaxID=3231269 RepID=UPI003459BF35